ncbi:branched-chain amino acid transaminase [Helicobacter cholecystus]|uniref:branched-chain amino acid transaminase n=1 Tax=Helicobacter cholecystus TaxID=45498 RepID=UPI0027381AC6|nr:branched-chain amino acid transaminase [Helicobacter cholecystus]
MNESQWIWKDGELVAWKDATTHVLSHTLHYGNSVFEGVRAYPTKRGLAIFRLKDHTQRLLDSAKIVAIDCPFDVDELNKAQIDILNANAFDGKTSVYLRPLIYLGYGSMGIAHWNAPVHVIVACWEWGNYLGGDSLEQGIRVKTSSFRRNSINSSLSKAKVAANYLNSQMARYEAHMCGFQECLLLDESGMVAEGSGECIFIVKNDVLITPPWDNTLKSITQESVMALAKSEGIEVRQRHITRDEIYSADEAFFVGTAAEIVPINELDFRKIGKQRHITPYLQDKFFTLVHGEDERFSHYLTYIKE